MAWVQDVQACGYESLAPKRSHRIYSLDYKLQVITYYRTHELSIDKVAAKFNLNRTQVYSWYRKYKNEGIVGLRSKPKGRPAKTMNKHKTINKYKIKPTKEEQYRQKIADLEAKIADQEMEIDILKKLQALRQQRGKNKH
jgi:transposase